MAQVKYFNGETELTRVTSMSNREFAVAFPGVAGRRFDAYAKLVGEPVDLVPTFDRAAQRWNHHYLPVERVVTFKSAPSLHECDARCMNAAGRTMNCECSCGGKNHGRAAFMCEAA